MKNKNTDLFDRRNSSAAAKKTLLENFRAAQTPELAAKLAERTAIAAARDERQAERARIKIAERERLKLEEEARIAEKEAAARAEAAEREAAEKALIVRVIEDEAARKAERDRRYAARKARRA